MENKKSQLDFGDVLESSYRFAKAASEELVSGVINNRIPARVTYGGLALAAGFYFRLDVWTLELLHRKSYLHGSLRSFLIYVCLMSGWGLWSLYRAGIRNRLLGKLKDAFESAKIKCNGRYPSLIEDLKIDEHVRRLRLLCHGVPFKDFQEGIPRLESVLNMTVVRLLQEPHDKSKIEVIYTMKDMSRKAILENPMAFGDCELPIGETYEGVVHVNMRSVGHILVAGQTGGGKSNFLKMAVSILTRNNPEADVIFLDFKGGMETADLRNHAQNLGSNIKTYEGTKSCVAELIRIGMGLDQRFASLAERGASNFDQYLKKRMKKERAKGETDRSLEEKRTFIIIDEIAQLYAHDTEVTKADRDIAKGAVNRISRQGRASGMHLIVATQKADTKEIDQTVKANLPGVLCFPTVNQSASVSALGSKRAFEINPEIKGRAVWKFGPQVQEVQTYLFE